MLDPCDGPTPNWPLGKRPRMTDEEKKILFGQTAATLAKAGA